MTEDATTQSGIDARAEMSRREFIARCSTGVLATMLVACQAESTKANSKASPGPTRQSSPTRQPSPARQQPSATKTPPLTNADWLALARSLQGTLVRPGNAQYATALQLFDPRFDSVQPAAIAYCVSPADVQTCLAFARHFALPLVPRSGGHSYAGYSTTSGIVLDVSRMSMIAVNTNAGTATVGAGARLIDVYAALAQYGLALPAGSCPTIGIAGLTQGGGVGVLGRKYGLTCDNLLSAQVITADGHMLTCDSSHNPDLFWALRGGGGGNFGVVTSFTFQTHPINTLTLFTLSWPWSNAAAVFDGWQRWAPQAPDELWSACWLQSTSNKGAEPIVQVNGVYIGDVASLNPLLQQLTNGIGMAPSGNYGSRAGLLDAMLYEAGCSGKTVEQCHLFSQDPNGQIGRTAFRAKSDYFTKPLPHEGIDALIRAISYCQSSYALGIGGIGFDAFGGAINRVAADATAFVHRDALFSAQYTVGWDTNDSNPFVEASHSWLTTTWQAMRPYASGTAYQNYIDPDLTNWQQAYYGANLPRLQQVKATYDPSNFFHFGQSIPPAL